jgi:hypothetical protein
MGRTAPISTVVIITADVDLDRSADGIRALLESFDRTSIFPSALVDAGMRHAVLDELRRDGVPVMEQRPLSPPTGPLSRMRWLFECVHWLRASDARVVYVPSADRDRVRLARRARRFAPRIDDVIEVSFAQAPHLSSGR